MIVDAIRELGPWAWWVLALLLMGLEIAVPGTFFLWFGISAFIIGSLGLAFGMQSDWWSWQVQVIGFVILAFVAMVLGRRYVARAEPVDGELLNQRARRLVGQLATLHDPIVNGVGRARIGDTTWRVTGPDLPAGAQVRITGAAQGTLAVEPEIVQPRPQPDF